MQIPLLILAAALATAAAAPMANSAAADMVLEHFHAPVLPEARSADAAPVAQLDPVTNTMTSRIFRTVD
jgi:hypothetical protein